MTVVKETAIAGVHIISPVPAHDERGWFSRTLDLDWLTDAGLEASFVHHNQSRSTRGVIRGLHVRAGEGETKLVRCARGTVVDFVVDVRPWSPTFTRSLRLVLDDVALEQLYLPPFVAHGFQVVTDEADVCYLHSRPYESGADVSISWADPSLGLEWPIAEPILSAKDRAAPALAELDLASVFVPANR